MQDVTRVMDTVDSFVYLCFIATMESCAGKQLKQAVNDSEVIGQFYGHMPISLRLLSRGLLSRPDFDNSIDNCI